MADEIKKSACFQCWHRCMVNLHIEDGKIVKIAPDTDANQQRLCIKGAAAIDFHDHPNRLNFPMKRKGKRGEDLWEKISWDQAMDEIAQKLEQIRKTYGPESVVTMGGTIHGHCDPMAWRWSNLFGTPNMIWLGKNCGEAQFLSDSAVLGYPGVGFVVPGVTKCAMLWGNNVAESAPVKGGLMMGYHDIQPAREKGLKLIVVDPRRTKTADLADLWLQIRPGTDGALGLGMLNIIINEGWYDKEFVEKWCLGFDQVKEVAREYSPKRVSEITWIPEKDIIKAAEWYATMRPAALSWGVADCQMGIGAGKSSVHVKSILRAITGSLDRIGGNFIGETPKRIKQIDNIMWDLQLKHPLKKRDNLGAEHWPISSSRAYKLYREAMARVYPKGFGAAQYMNFVASYSIWRGILTGEPYPVKAVIGQGSNPIVTHGGARTIYKALKSDNLSLHLNMDYTLTPTNMLADYVLPATGWLEKAEMVDIWGFADIQHGTKPIVSPLYERHDDYDLWRDIGNRLGQEGHWPENLTAMFDKLLESAGLNFDELCSLPARTLAADLSEDQSGAKGFGGSVLPEEKRYEVRGFGTFSGKVELVPTIFEKLGYDPLPRYVEPARSPVSTPELFKEYPLILMGGSRVKNYQHTRFRELDKVRKTYPHPLLAIHPDTADALGIADGDPVYIETPEGRIKQRANIFDGIHPKVVHADSMWWFPELPGKDPSLFGVWESNINAIVPDGPEYCDYAGDNYIRGLLCRVYKANE